MAAFSQPMDVGVPLKSPKFKSNDLNPYDYFPGVS